MDGTDVRGGELFRSCTMSTTRRSRPRIGDIVQFPLSRGFAYAQYVLKHDQPPHFGPLICVFEGIFESPLDTLDSLLSAKERFLAFIPLGTAVQQRLVEIVGHQPVPPRYAKFPLFKAAGHRDPVTRQVVEWWIWDGVESSRAEALTEQQKALSLKEIPGYDVLIERIESGWSPRDEVTWTWKGK